MTATAVQQALRAVGDPVRAVSSARYFKTGPGQYGAGDQFIGVTVPLQRQVAKQFRALPLSEIESLLSSLVHEDRLTAVFLLVQRFQSGNSAMRQSIYDFYLAHTPAINNWDLVDSSAGYIVGGWLLDRDRSILDQLASSDLIWERRIAIIATQPFIRADEYQDTLRLASRLLHDPHDLIHKAVGWMLREVGNRNQRALRQFLDDHAAIMPRTMLRYAIEKLDPDTRQYYSQLKS